MISVKRKPIKFLLLLILTILTLTYLHYLFEISATANPPPPGYIIISFDDYQSKYSVEYGTLEVDLPFPESLEGTASNGDVEMPVTIDIDAWEPQDGATPAVTTDIGAWETQDGATYNHQPAVTTTYTYKAVMSYDVADGVEIPTIEVEVNADGVTPRVFSLVEYLDENGELKNVTAEQIRHEEINEILVLGEEETTSWYFVTGEVAVINNTDSVAINAYGDCNIILGDDAVLTAEANHHGIGIATSSLSIYSQSFGPQMGKLTAMAGHENFAGIACEEEKGLFIYGGEIEAYGGNLDDSGSETVGNGAGIGSGYNVSAGTITITNGNITAYSRGVGAGIGSGYQYGTSSGIGYGTIHISGGTINATGRGAGIGNGYNANGSTVIISGGKVTASSEYAQAGISGDAVNISGGEVTASGQNGEPGIRGVMVTISDGIVVATGGGSNDYVGGNGIESNDTITITGGTVTATGGDSSSNISGFGIGGTYNGYITINISGGTVNATSGNGCAAIAGGYFNGNGIEDYSVSSINISGGFVTAVSSANGAGIASAGHVVSINDFEYYYIGSDITISGGTVVATGDGDFPGIGGIETEVSHDVGITITGGSVNSNISPQPVNGLGAEVYINTLCFQLEDPVTYDHVSLVNSLITECVIDRDAISYGINDVETDNDGNLHLWLPVTDVSENNTPGHVYAMAEGIEYLGTYFRTTDNNTIYMFELVEIDLELWDPESETPAGDCEPELQISSAEYGYESAPELSLRVVNSLQMLTESDEPNPYAYGFTVLYDNANEYFSVEDNTPGFLVPGRVGRGIITVKPVTGLPIGDYEIDLTVFARNAYEVLNTTISFTVTLQTPMNVDIQEPSPVQIDDEVTLRTPAEISDGGDLSYRWYRNNALSNEGGTLISGETNDTYIPDTSVPGIYYYYVEVMNTLDNNMKVINSNAVTLIVQETTPDASIDYVKEQLTNLDPTASYTVNNVAVTVNANGTVDIQEGWFEGVISIVKINTEPGADASTNSIAQSLTIPARPPQPIGVSGNNETVAGLEDGVIRGVTTDMEYRNDSDGIWHEVTGTEIRNLPAGDYSVRMKAVQADNSFPGLSVLVRIATGETPTYTLNAGNITFDSLVTGYDRPVAREINIFNSGNSVAAIDRVTVSGSAFEIGGSGESVPVEDSINTWTVQPVEGLSIGVYRETISIEYNGEIATAQVTFIVRESPPDISIDYVNARLTGFDASGSYTINGVEEIPEGEYITIKTDWFGTSVAIVKVNADPNANSTAQTFDIPERPSEPTVSVVNETVLGIRDGMITEVTTAMEYSTNGGATWITITGTEITGLTAGDYLVRVKAVVGETFTGDSAAVTVMYESEPNYLLETDTVTFDTVEFDYTRPVAKNIIITNSGNITTAIDRVTVSGSAFEIGGSGESVPVEDSINTWTVQPVEGLSIGVYRETISIEYNGEIATAQVTFIVQESTPDISIDYVNARLTGFDASGSYTINGVEEIPEGEYITIKTDWFGTSVAIVKVNADPNANSTAQTFDIPERPSEPTVSVVNETVLGIRDGMITNVTTAMEYSINGGVTWITITGTEITGLTAGDYLVRVKAVVGETFTGDSAAVTVMYESEPNYLLKADDITFNTVEFEYTRLAEKNIVISNLGNYDVVIDRVTVSGSAFEIGGSGELVSVGDSINTWTVQPVEGLSIGVYRETISIEYNGEIATAQVTFIVRESPPDISIDYVNARLIGFDASGSYTINGAEEIPEGEYITIKTDWFGTSVAIVKVNADTDANSTAQILDIPERPSEPTVTVVDETISGLSDGRITNVTTAMEYSINGGVTWITITGTEIIGLTAGQYLVRIRAVAGEMFSGSSAAVTVAYESESTYMLTIGDVTFDTAGIGYTRPDAVNLTIFNSGNTATVIDSVTVSGSVFEISGSGGTVPAGSTIDTWTVQPVIGLSAATYTETISVLYNGDITATAQVTFTVKEYEIDAQGVLTKYYGQGGAVVIPANVTRIDNNVFASCELTSVTFENGSALESIGSYAFDSCTSMNIISFPNSVIYLEEGAFNKCTSLTNIIIPKNVQAIGDYAFADCTGISSIVFGAGSELKTIGSLAFYNCVISTITVPDKVTNIGTRAFSSPTLKEILVETENTSYTSIDGVLFSKDLMSLICYPSNKTQESYTVQDNVAVIAEYSFAGSSLHNVNIPDSVEKIEANAFRACSNLISVEITNNSYMTELGLHAFVGCDKLVVFLPDSLEMATIYNPFVDEGLPMSSSNITVYAYYDSDIAQWCRENGHTYRIRPSSVEMQASPPSLMYEMIPYLFMAQTKVPNNEGLCFWIKRDGEDAELPLGLKLVDGITVDPQFPNYPPGTIYGAPLDYEDFKDGVTFTLYAQNVGDLEGLFSASAEFTIKLAERPTNEQLEKENAYNFIPDEETGSNGKIDDVIIGDRNSDIPNQVLHTEGDYGLFENVWLNGNVLKRNEEYLDEEGSTKITILSQTIKNLDNGEHMVAVAFRRADGLEGENGALDIVAQSFTVNLTDSSTTPTTTTTTTSGHGSVPVTSLTTTTTTTTTTTSHTAMSPIPTGAGAGATTTTTVPFTTNSTLTSPTITVPLTTPTITSPAATTYVTTEPTSTKSTLATSVSTEPAPADSIVTASVTTTVTSFNLPTATTDVITTVTTTSALSNPIATVSVTTTLDNSVNNIDIENPTASEISGLDTDENGNYLFTLDGSGASMEIEIDLPLEELSDLYVNEELWQLGVDYEAYSGSTIFVISASRLEKLETGAYTMKAIFDKQTVEFTVLLTNPNVPKAAVTEQTEPVIAVPESTNSQRENVAETETDVERNKDNAVPIAIGTVVILTSAVIFGIIIKRRKGAGKV